MLAASVFVVALARRIGWPSILGYLVVGMALGPHALRLITQANIIDDLAQLGVVFLLNNLDFFEVERVIRYWPVLLIGVGVYMLYLRMSSSSENGGGQ